MNIYTNGDAFKLANPNTINVQKQYIVPRDKFNEYLILGLCIFFFVVAWIIILYYARGYKETNKSNTSTKSQNLNPTSSGVNRGFGNLEANPVYQSCPPGECPTNIANGEKRCPINSLQEILYDPTYEVCNPVDACTNSQTPYAELFDESTSLEGICNYPMCRCLNYATTPAYTQVLFEVQGGDLYTSNPQLLDKWFLNQLPNTAIGQGNVIGMRYSDPTTQFFTIAPSVLSKLANSTPICKELFQGGPEIDSFDMLKCVNSNPCQLGKMAYIMGYNQFVTNFDPIGEATTVPLACVPASLDNPKNDTDGSLECPNDNFAPVFNYITGKIYCIPPNNIFF